MTVFEDMTAGPARRRDCGGYSQATVSCGDNLIFDTCDLRQNVVEYFFLDFERP